MLGPGWARLASELVDELREIDPEADVDRVESDEFGLLRLRLARGAPRVTRRAVRQLERRALITCELCGAPVASMAEPSCASAAKAVPPTPDANRPPGDGAHRLPQLIALRPARTSSIPHRSEAASAASEREFGWGPQEDDASIAAIHRALELGVNWIDTAAAYGFGRSELVVGRAVEGLAERPYVFTKASLLEGPARRVVHSLKRDSLLREAEASLQRLRVEAIDLYQLHWPIPEEDIDEGWSALAELKEQELVRHIGVSNFTVEQLRRIQQIAPVETLQPPYSLVERDAEDDVLPFAEREAIGVIVYSPMGSGLLTGQLTRERIDALPDDDWRKDDPRFREPRLSRHLALVQRLQAVADRLDTTPGAVAVAWSLRDPAVDGAIVGFRRPDQVDPILGAASLELTDEDLNEIEGRH
jgi:aryl-alcohol dehydrogenase-like predicted oxidoreductase